MSYDKNSWKIYNNSIFSQISTLDCNDAMEGECYRDKTLEECVDMCYKSPECDLGYYISGLPTKTGKLCIPLRNENINSNPMFRIRDQNVYKEMKGLKSSVFINKDKYKDVNKLTNSVFYRDNFILKNTETNQFLETSPLSDIKKTVNTEFSNDGNLILQILQVPADKSVDSEYIPVRYGDKIMFNIPNTTLIMVHDPDTNTIKWESHDYSIDTQMYYTIKPVDTNKKMGDIIEYSDNFSIHINVFILGVDKTSHVEVLYYADFKQAKEKERDVTFMFIPRINGWYCDNIDKKCKEISISSIKKGKDGLFTYNKNIVSRVPNCINTECHKRNENFYLKIIVISFIVIVICSVLLKYYLL